MMVHVLMPVFNRFAMTKRMVDCLRAQSVDEQTNLIVVDDGSTDGTGEYLAEQQDVTVIQGDGNLWWGGSIDFAFHHVFGIAKPSDWILLMNNDTQVNPDFLQCLLDTARHNAPAAVGSVVRDNEEPHRLLSVGIRVNPWWLLVSDIMGTLGYQTDVGDLPDMVEVDALSGRGVLFPVSSIKVAGGMRTRWLPHYWADYELSLRIRKAGWRLLVDMNAVVYSKDEHGSACRASSLKERLFTVRSPVYLPSVLIFWWEASTWLQRSTLPFRVVIFLIFPWLRGARK